MVRNVIDHRYAKLKSQQNPTFAPSQIKHLVQIFHRKVQQVTINFNMAYV